MTSNANPSLLLLFRGFKVKFTLQGILLLLLILKRSVYPLGFVEAIMVPNKKTMSSSAKTFALSIYYVFINSKDGTTVYSSKILSKSVVLIPGIHDSPASTYGIPRG